MLGESVEHWRESPRCGQRRSPSLSKFVSSCVFALSRRWMYHSASGIIAILCKGIDLLNGMGQIILEHDRIDYCVILV